MAMQRGVHAVEEVAKPFDLEDFVKNATWRDLLLNLVESNKLNPWDVDISRIVAEYLKVIKSMKVLDLFVPANIMLAASILLKLKSDTISFDDRVEQIPENDDAHIRIIPDVPQLTLRARQQPNKKITLEDLMDALEEAMKIEKKRDMQFKSDAIPIQFRINKEDIDDKMENIYMMVKKTSDSYGTTTFAALACNFVHAESILLDLFVPLLFLSHNSRIALMQDGFFKEIFIKVI